MAILMQVPQNSMTHGRAASKWKGLPQNADETEDYEAKPLGAIAARISAWAGRYVREHVFSRQDFERFKQRANLTRIRPIVLEEPATLSVRGGEARWFRDDGSEIPQ